MIPRRQQALQATPSRHVLAVLKRRCDAISRSKQEQQQLREFPPIPVGVGPFAAAGDCPSILPASLTIQFGGGGGVRGGAGTLNAYAGQDSIVRLIGCLHWVVQHGSAL